MNYWCKLYTLLLREMFNIFPPILLQVIIKTSSMVIIIIIGGAIQGYYAIQVLHIRLSYSDNWRLGTTY